MPLVGDNPRLADTEPVTSRGAFDSGTRKQPADREPVPSRQAPLSQVVDERCGKQGTRFTWLYYDDEFSW
jgi:hypothetical protein